MAQSDPIGFIANLPKPAILDEIQLVPDLYLTIKKDVDENRLPGRYILTGSTHPLMVPRLSNALVGRMELFTLFPLSQGELRGVKETFIDRVYSDEKPLLTYEKITKSELSASMITGGYPSVQDYTPAEWESWINSYITTILQRDVQELAQISGIREFPNLLRLLATRAGNLLNGAELSRASGIPQSTLSRYLALLEALYILNFQRPWFSHLGNRFVRSPKTFFVDTGILAFLLGIDSQRFIHEPTRIGPLFENFVLSELRKQATWNDRHINLFHFRTLKNIEVDIVLEDRAGNLVGIEVKANQTVSSEDFKGLRHLKEKAGSKFKRGIVLYTGTEFIPVSSTLSALPVTALWA